VNLDDDLAAWVATVRLPEADAAAIFQRIVASTGPSAAPAERPAAPAAAPSLDPSWWRGYNAGFAARMVASTAPVRLAA
jgi:anti-sigma factor RsiW